MDWINYHHLLYFWTVSREGSIARACRILHVTQPTISGQIRLLEQSLGAPLFERAGRGLKLTETGRLVHRYADEIFGLGRELMDFIRDRPAGQPLRLTVGVTDSVPKLIAFRLLQGTLRLPEPVRIVCREDRPQALLTDLAAHELDVVIADAPVGSGFVRTFHHELGESGVALFAAERLARIHRRGFPRSLDHAPMLLPSEGSSLRRSLQQWFDAEGIRPRIVGEFDDSALMKVFGQSGAGIFPVHAAIARDVARQFRVRRVGSLEGVRERFYAITAERRLRHPAVVAIQEQARRRIFG